MLYYYGKNFSCLSFVHCLLLLQLDHYASYVYRYKKTSSTYFYIIAGEKKRVSNVQTAISSQTASCDVKVLPPLLLLPLSPLFSLYKPYGSLIYHCSVQEKTEREREEACSSTYWLCSRLSHSLSQTTYTATTVTTIYNGFRQDTTLEKEGSGVFLHRAYNIMHQVLILNSSRSFLSSQLFCILTERASELVVGKNRYNISTNVRGSQLYFVLVHRGVLCASRKSK